MLKFWITILSLWVFGEVAPSPTYLFAAPRALAGLATTASASASDQKPQALTNIADLRKQRKSARLEAEKDQSEDAGALEATSQEETANEASPGIVHKKVSKILTKLKLITQFKNAVHQDEEKDEEIKKNDEQFEKELAEFDRELEEDVKKENLESSEHIQTFKKEEEDSTTENQTPGYLYPTKDDMPKLVYLNLAEKVAPGRKLNVELEEKLEKRSEKQINGRFGDIGVFFTELVGTLVALAYGAAIQITGSGGQS